MIMRVSLHFFSCLSNVAEAIMHGGGKLVGCRYFCVHPTAQNAIWGFTIGTTIAWIENESIHYVGAL